MISFGNKKIKDIFLGERQVKKVYLGTKEIYSATNKVFLHVILKNYSEKYFEYTVSIRNNGTTVSYTSHETQTYEIPYGAEVRINYSAQDLEVILQQSFWPSFTQNQDTIITVKQLQCSYSCAALIEKTKIDLCPSGQAEEWFPSYTTVTLYFKGEIIYQSTLSEENRYGGELFYYGDSYGITGTPQQGDFTCSIVYEDPYPDMPHTIEFSNSVSFDIWEEAKEVQIIISVNE